MATTLHTDAFFDTVTGLQVTDMSGANKIVTDWIFFGTGAQVGATFVWPATGAPEGVCGVEGSNDPVAGIGTPTSRLAITGDAMDLTAFSPAPVQPEGTAGRMPLFFKSRAAFGRFTYLRASGGEGAALTIHVHA